MKLKDAEKNPRLLLMADVVHEVIVSIEERLGGLDELNTRRNKIAWLSEAVESAIEKIVRKHDLGDRHLPFESDISPEYDAETQIALELGWYVRLAEPTARDVGAAMCLGRTEDMVRLLVHPLIGARIEDYFQHCVDNDEDPKQGVFQRLGELYPHDWPMRNTMRCIVAVGEAESDVFDINQVMGEVLQGIDAYGDAIPDADWYWEAVVQDALEGWVEMSMTVTEDECLMSDIPVVNTNTEDYLEEWYWDIFASRIGWQGLDWEKTATWAIHDIKLQDMVQWTVITALAKELKEQFFASDEQQREWRHMNR